MLLKEQEKQPELNNQPDFRETLLSRPKRAGSDRRCHPESHYKPEMAQLMQWLWREEYWLPPGVTWEDMQETEDVHYPQPWHLLLSLPITLLLVALQVFFERKIFTPLSKKLGLREKVGWKSSPNPVLEAFYMKWRKHPQKGEVISLAKQCDLQPRQVERWFRNRLSQDQPSLTQKFCDACWRATCYAISFCTGLAILYDKPWLWDLHECWVGYPQQPLQPSIFGYYLMQFSFYCSLLIMQPFVVKQTDFCEQIVHHVATIFLIGFSYCANYLRIGLLVMVLHEIPDCLLYLTKMYLYLKWQKTSDALFVTFAAVFLFTRLVVFPCKILYNVYYFFTELVEPYFGTYFFSTLLIVLQLLHVFWSYLIICMFYRFLIHGKVGKDVRSDSEGSEDEESQKAEEKNSTINPQPDCHPPCVTKRAPL